MTVEDYREAWKLFKAGKIKVNQSFTVTCYDSVARFIKLDYPTVDAIGLPVEYVIK